MHFFFLLKSMPESYPQPALLHSSSFSAFWPFQTTINLCAKLVNTILGFNGWGTSKPNYTAFISEACVEELIFFFSFFFCTAQGNNLIMMIRTPSENDQTNIKMKGPSKKPNSWIEVTPNYVPCWVAGMLV